MSCIFRQQPTVLRQWRHGDTNEKANPKEVGFFNSGGPPGSRTRHQRIMSLNPEAATSPHCQSNHRLRVYIASNRHAPNGTIVDSKLTPISSQARPNHSSTLIPSHGLSTEPPRAIPPTPCKSLLALFALFGPFCSCNFLHRSFLFLF